jgi:predicted acetyltransferase
MRGPREATLVTGTRSPERLVVQGEQDDLADRLSDGVIDLVLADRTPADPSKGYVPSLQYHITLHGSDIRIGAIRLRTGYAPSLLYAGHIGYDVEEIHRGHHFAARACLLLQEVAMAEGLTRLIMTCDPSNVASRRTCERVGAKKEGIFDLPPEHGLFRKGYRQISRYNWDLSETNSGRF